MLQLTEDVKGCTQHHHIGKVVAQPKDPESRHVAPFLRSGARHIVINGTYACAIRLVCLFMLLTCTYMHRVCMCVRMCTHVCMCVHVCVCTCVCMCVYVCTNIYIVSKCKKKNTHACIILKKVKIHAGQHYMPNRTIRPCAV